MGTNGKIKSWEYTNQIMAKEPYEACIVGGLGHVGLPLGITLAEAGRKVVLYDIDQTSLGKVTNGQMPFKEEGSGARLKTVLGKNLFVSASKEVISQSHFIIMVLGTPIDSHLNPNYTLFKDVFNKIIDHIEDHQHIILRSTVLPGTTEKIFDYLCSQGKRPQISFCPERIIEGKAFQELAKIPQIIGAFNEAAFVEAKELFSSLTDEIIFLSPLEAELGKLYTNAWRYIQFSVANQFYEIATQHNLDYYKIHQAITYKYPRAQALPGAGFTSGPCLYKDTMQLSAFSNNNFFLGHAAMMVNEGLPAFIVSQLKQKFTLTDKTVGILGMTFKANSDDMRDSLSYKLKNILEMEAGRVICSDIYVKEESFVTKEELIAQADIIILATPHKEYKSLRIKDKVVVDVWNFFGNGGLF